MLLKLPISLILTSLCLSACEAGIAQKQNSGDFPAQSGISTLANVVKVTASNTQFSVSIVSNETGCALYADWWEVLSPQGELLYRRVLAHSHPNEQPFTRSGGPVNIAEDQLVIVRAHMYPNGYGGQAMYGSINSGFEIMTLDDEFAGNVDQTPVNCAF